VCVCVACGVRVRVCVRSAGKDTPLSHYLQNFPHFIQLVSFH
jgi:hypothetical protein